MGTPRRLTASQLPDRIASLPAGDLVVALSGGADSAALAWAATAGGRSVRAIHIDHARPASAMLARAADRIADQLGIELDVHEIATPGPFSEAAAREARYEILESERREGEWLLTGHTADDLAETVLMNVARGSGLDGLAGIPSRRGRVIRPFLDIRRSETRQVATLAGLPWVDDPDNDDARFLRNRLRSMLTDDWEETFGAGSIEGLVRSASIARSEGQVLDEIAGRIVHGGPHAGGIDIVIGEVLAAGQVLAARAIRSAFRERFGSPPPRGVVDGVWALATGASAGAIDVAPGKLVSEPPLIRLVVADEGPPAGPTLITGPGRFRWGDWTFEVAPGPVPAAFPLTSRAAVLPDMTLNVRGAAETDRVPVGGGHRPVADLLGDAGIPSRTWSQHPVVVGGSEVVWVPGVRRWPSSQVGSGSGYLWAVADRGRP